MRAANEARGYAVGFHGILEINRERQANTLSSVFTLSAIVALYY